MFLDNDELIPAIPRQKAVFRQNTRQKRSKVLNVKIPLLMSEVIVHLL